MCRKKEKVIKKVLVFNFAGPEDRMGMPGGDNNGDFRGYYGWQQSIASLMDGLVSLPDVTVFSTTPLNYGYKVPLRNSERREVVTSFGKTCYSYVLDEESYVKECKDVADECDVILIMEEENPENVEGEIPDDLGGLWGVGRSHPTTYFRNEKGDVVKHLHRYMLDNNKGKVVFLEGGDDRYGPQYAVHPENQPPCYKVFFKRETELGKSYSGNVISFPFATEEIYFTGGKDFDKIWNNKKLDMVSLFREKFNSRHSIKQALVENFEDNSKCIVEYNSLDFKDRDSNGIHKEEGEAFLNAFISVDGEPGQGCYYTDRMFKSLAAGCCLFLPTPAYNVDFPNGFKDKENVIIYNKDNPNDLIDKINYYLNNRDDLKRIAKSGFDNLLKYHTSEARAKEFIETCERYINGS